MLNILGFQKWRRKNTEKNETIRNYFEKSDPLPKVAFLIDAYWITTFFVIVVFPPITLTK